MSALEKQDPNQLFDSHSTFNEISDNDYPAQRRRLLEALSYLKKLEDNWNGVDAKKPTTQAVSMAEHFVSCLFLSKEHADYIEPDGDGGIILKWKKDSHRIFLTIDGTALHLSYEESGNDPVFIDDIQFFNTDNNLLPREVLDYIPNRVVNA